MTHRIVVLGAGYAGLTAATRVARHRPDARVTLVNARADFVERIRLHQIAAGQRPRTYALAERVRGTGVGLVIGHVRSVDPEHRTVRVDDRVLDYDTLVYALGSEADTRGVPGVAEYAHTVADLGGARGMGERVADLAAERGAVTVVGGGLTGVEAATELAESHPDLRVRLVTEGEPIDWLSPRGHRYLRRCLDRLGIDVHTDATVREVRDDAVVLAGGRAVDSGLTLWAAGFAVSDLAARAGLAVNARGRVEVDATLRSVSHPDVYAVGDSAAALRADGRETPMGCAASLPGGQAVADTIAARLVGRDGRPFRYRCPARCVSLGRRDGLIQFLDPDGRSRDTVLTGRAAARFKEGIVRGGAVAVRHSGPYAPLPRRERRLPARPANGDGDVAGRVESPVGARPAGG